MILTNYYYLNELGSKKNQEDFIWPSPLAVGPSNKIFIVCDGVGGSSNGEVASRIVAQYVGNALMKTDLSLISVESINQLLQEAKNALNEHSRRENSGRDMATTFAMLVFNSNKAFIAWCGDSRVYHFRKGTILYKTEDHSLVNSLVKSGELTEMEASLHPQKNIILKAVKADAAFIDAEGGWTSAIETGDYFLLCTDGLLENWNSEELAELLNKNEKTNIDMVAAIQSRCLNNTRDNYSMYLLKVKLEQNGDRKKAKGGIFLLLLFLFLVVSVAAYFFFDRPKLAAGTPVIKNKIPQIKDTSSTTDSAVRLVNKTTDTILAPAPFVEIINPEKKAKNAKSLPDSIFVNKQQTGKKYRAKDIDSGSIRKKIITPENNNDTSGAQLPHE